MKAKNLIFPAVTYRLPMPPDDVSSRSDEMDIYVRFMRHLRCVPTSHPAIKVLSAIQFTGNMLVASDAHIAKSLVDMGLRAPRKAFPAAFLDYADQALTRNSWDIGGPNSALRSLDRHWHEIGEDPFEGVSREYALYEQGVQV